MNIRQLCSLIQPVSVTSSFGTSEAVFGGSENLPNGSHFFLIATNTALNLLKTSTYIACFNVSFAASSSQQWWVHTICTVKNNVMLQLCWFLFEHESQDVYNAMLSLLRAKLGTWQFHFVMCDENPLMVDALKNIFGVEIVFSVHQNVTNITRLAATHVEYFRNHPTHWSTFKRVIRLCFGLQFLPQRLMLKGLAVVRQEAMDCDNFVFDCLWPIVEEIATPPLHFSVCGCEEKTNYFRETSLNQMYMLCLRQQHRTQQFIGNILRMATTTIEDAHLLRLGRKPLNARPSRICTPLSENTTVKSLTEGILRPTFQVEFLILNFLHEVSNIILSSSTFFEGNIFI